MDLKEKYAHLFNVISSPRFLQMRGLGNELPFFICPFNPAEALEINARNALLKKKLANAGVNILEINLYDVCLGLLQEDDQLTDLVAAEPETPKNEILDYLQGVLAPETHLVPAISQILQTSPHDAVFLSGIGEVYPYIRSHTILNNLHATAGKRPLVMFFPGEYTVVPGEGSSLDLFGRLHDDKYYRAFNIFHFQP